MFVNESYVYFQILARFWIVTTASGLLFTSVYIRLWLLKQYYKQFTLQYMKIQTKTNLSP